MINSIHKITECQAAARHLVLLLTLLVPSVASAEPFKVMSFNILADFLDDSFGDWNFDPSGPRRDRVGAIFDQEDADLIGLQEVDNSQYLDLVNLLPDYDNVRLGWNAIFFKRDRFQLLNNGSFDYSTPDSRFAIWAQLRDTSTNESLVMFNTHLSHNNSNYRLAQAADMQAAIPGIAGDLPVVLTGDFNFVYSGSPESGITDHFLQITGRAGIQNRLLVDACSPFCGRTASFGSSRRIDFVTNSDEFQVTDAEVVTTLVDGRRPSDHRPVTAELLFTPVGSERTRWPIQSGVLLDRDINGSDDLFVHSQLIPQAPIGVYTSNRILNSGDSLIEGKFDMRFTVPEATDSSPDIASAVLRLYVNEVVGNLRGGLSLTHSVDDNRFGVIIRRPRRSPYMDTGLDLIVPSDGVGMYYELDVTDFVLADMLADGSNPLAAFRLEITDGPPLAPDEEAAYVINSMQFAPQLVITFVPEASDLIMLLTSGVADLVEDGVLNKGQGNSLLMKLNFNSNQQATLNRIGALINQVNAFVNAGRLTFEEGQSLIDTAESLHDILSVEGGFDVDSDMDGSDFLKWQRGGSPNPLSASDLADWKANYGMVATLTATSAAVPEPTTTALALAALCLAMFRRRSF